MNDLDRATSSEREDLFFEANLAATKLESLYQNKQKIYENFLYYLRECRDFLVQKISLYTDNRESSEGEKFLDEIIGELEGTYCAIEQFEKAVADFERIIDEQFHDTTLCVGMEVILKF